jgi:tetratricopeptide (TPR) repeat protein
VHDFSRAIELLPTNADFYHNRGFCHRKQGNYGAAVADYSAALRCEPGHFKAVYNRAFSLDKLGRWATLTRLRRPKLKQFEFLTSHNNPFGSYLSLKHILPPCWANDEMNNLSDTMNPRRDDRFDEALSDYTRALEVQPGNANVFHNRGNIYERLKRYPEALQDFARAIDLSPPAPSSRHARYGSSKGSGAWIDVIHSKIIISILA